MDREEATEEYRELGRLADETVRVAKKGLTAHFYNRSVDGKTDSPKQLLTDLSALQRDLENAGPSRLWRSRRDLEFLKVQCLKLQWDEQGKETDPALLFTADEIADIRAAIELVRAIKKRAIERSKRKR